MNTINERIPYKVCPLCDSPKIAPYVTANCLGHHCYDTRLQATINWSKCADCAHVFTEGFYTEEACKIVFEKTAEVQQGGKQLEESRSIAAKMIDRVLPFVAEGLWLDVGFGNGSLLLTAKEYGFDPIGIDLRAENVDELNKLGIEAHCKDITKLALKRKCAVISMADVLEHMPYPRMALSAAHKLLKKGGVLFVTTQNSESPMWDILNAQHSNPYWGEMEHYHNFSRSRLYALLREFGFSPKSYSVSERYRIGMEITAVKT